MTDQISEHRSRDWQDYLPWLIIFRALRPAISFRLLTLSAIGLIGTVAGWRSFWNLLVRPYKDDAGVMVYPDPVISRLAGQPGTSWPPWPWENEFARLPGFGPTASWSDSWLASVWNSASQLTLPFQFLFDRDVSYVGLAYILACLLWALAVWAFFGGMITRTAVLRLTRDEMAAWPLVREFGKSKWSSYFSAPLFPLLGIALTAVPIAVLGLLMRFGTGAVIAGILWPLALLGSLFMAILLVGLMFGWPLMWSTISTEGTDAFDALSRSYAYVFQRPFHYLFYVLVASGVGTIGWYIVHGFAALVIHLGKWAASWGASAERVRFVTDHGLDSDMGAFATLLFMFWHNVVLTLAVSFSVSFFWCAASAIYLLLRRQVDAVEVDEVHLDEQEARYGLPPLETDEQGVPGVADESAPEASSAGPSETPADEH